MTKQEEYDKEIKKACVDIVRDQRGDIEKSFSWWVNHYKHDRFYQELFAAIINSRETGKDGFDYAYSLLEKAMDDASPLGARRLLSSLAQGLPYRGTWGGRERCSPPFNYSLPKMEEGSDE